MLRRLFASTALIALGAGAAHAETTLHILHINDFHSRIEPINRSDGTCNAEQDAAGECVGGVARLYTMINAMRAEIEAAGESVLVMDAGDQFQGSLMYTTYKGAAEAEFMEAIGFDVMAVGNHEFDDGPEVFRTFLDTVSFPVISSNLDLSQSNVLNGEILPWTILEAGGLQVGVISALATDTPETSSPGPAVIFQDEIDALTAAVEAVRAEGADIVIALTHVGLPTDLEIAAAVPGLTAVIGGHSHTYLSASDPNRQGAYPTWVSREDGGLVPVVTAGAYGRYVGHLRLTIADDGSLIHAEGDTVLVAADIVPDPAIAARVAELGGPIEELRARVVAAAADEIDGTRENCRQRECEMGNLVADAMLARTAGQGVTIAIQNGGGLRASIGAGEVTMGAVLTVLPFQNTLATFQTTGAAIVGALENGVSAVADGAGRFPQVAGLRYTFDPALPAGERVSDVQVMVNGAWAPIDPDATYGVATNNYVRQGGDGYALFAAQAVNPYDYGPDLADVVAEFMAQNAPYTPYLDGRITRVE